jgi:hypothetical protein
MKNEWITDEEILKMDFYDFCGVAAAWMTDEDKIKWFRDTFNETKQQEK